MFFICFNKKIILIFRFLFLLIDIFKIFDSFPLWKVMFFSHYFDRSEKMIKNMKSAGIDGYFIPAEEFEKGLFLDEQQKLSLQAKILENDKLIQSLKADLDLLGGDD